MGRWQVLPYQAPILPIHIALLRTGKVLVVAGSGNNPSNTSDQNLLNACAVWDVTAGSFTRPAIPLNASGHPLDLFCAGHSFRSEGHLMVAGGTIRYDPFQGLPTALFFDPGTGNWLTKPSMHHGRWYPTVLTLGSGRIFALSGLDENGNLNNQPEIYSVTFANGWNAFPSTSRIPMYAQLFLLASGRIFFSGGCMGSNNGVGPRVLTIPGTFSQAITETPVSGLAAANATDQATSVLLPPAQAQRIMILGGGDPSGIAVNRVAIADFTAATPTYATAPSLRFARMHVNAVLLPDRTVFVCNGSRMGENTSTSMLPAEIYNPATNTWTTAETPSVPRVYHSVALLMPDGRVITAGGNPSRGTNELRLEIYSPSYMSRPRPVIQSAPTTSKYGATITIQTPQAATIKWVSLIRASANTHSCDTEQRLVDVPITARTSTTLTASVTGRSNIAPPGFYMLFITDNNGVPSVATWIQLS
ncbi:MAG: Kelch repeat-containing protein [Chloroflexi bacterium]|nr:Kelch repeat-containing protein [Chloroflexota bacterium]